MTQNDLNREVAAATGETVAEISRRGFQPLTPAPYEIEADDEVLDRYLDWDEIDLHRNVRVVEQPPRQVVAGFDASSQKLGRSDSASIGVTG